MTKVDEILARHYRPEDHPYRQYERMISAELQPQHTILDAGCGRSAPVLSQFVGQARELIGVDLEDLSAADSEVRYIQGNIASIDMPDNSVDVVISRAVLEHVPEAEPVFEEICRILKPGGSFICLTPNLWDYVSIISFIVPNRFHPYIVNKTEGRKLHDVFPSYYQANTRRSVRRLCVHSGLVLKDFQWLSQYPASFMFSALLFRLAMVYEKLISRFDSLAFLRGWILFQAIKPVAPELAADNRPA